MSMTHRERIEAVVRGEQPDQTPIALWRHFPIDDESAERSANAHVAFQRKYQFDLVKVTPASGYPAEAWGGELINRQNNTEGTREYTKRVVTQPSDWLNLKTLDAHQGVWARELEALRQIRAGVGDDIHVLQTIFSPLTIGKQLSGERVLNDMREHPEEFAKGMSIVSDVTAQFAVECLKNGADGIFFATQYASLDKVTREEYNRFGVPYDMPIFDAIQDHSQLNLLHLHGTRPIFELANQYPIHIVNWHDRETQPSLGTGLNMLNKGAVLGGLDREGVFETGTPDEVIAQTRDALSQVSTPQLIIGTGCVAFITTPDDNIQAAIETTRET